MRVFGLSAIVCAAWGRHPNLPDLSLSEDCIKAIARETDNLISVLKETVEPQISGDLARGFFSKREIIDRADDLIAKAAAEAEVRVSAICDDSLLSSPRVITEVIVREFNVIAKEIEKGCDLSDRVLKLRRIGSDWIPTSYQDVVRARLDTLRIAYEENARISLELQQYKDDVVLGKLANSLLAVSGVSAQRLATMLRRLEAQLERLR
jgi:hypothetical protein